MVGLAAVGNIAGGIGLVTALRLVQAAPTRSRTSSGARGSRPAAAILQQHRVGVGRARLFERFSAGRTGRVEGTSTGLGLSIVRALARAHGGDAWLEAGDDRPGACFVVRLPAAR